tara:strand:+ start:20 stop:976 length:957 start_codon:yes stop_codon:yes gene_type:complete
MSTQLTKLALINIATDGSGNLNALSETQTFSVVQDGAAEASRQVLSIEPNTVTIENERELINSKIYNILISGFYSSAAQQTQLRTWAKNQTSLFFSGFGLDGSILQGEGTLSMARGFENRLSFRISSPREATGGYVSATGKHTSDLMYSQNGLCLFKWARGNTDDAAGYEFGGSSSNINATTLFDTSDEDQRIHTSGAITFERLIHFPFPLTKLTAFVEVTEASEATTNLSIKAYNSSNSALAGIADDSGFDTRIGTPTALNATGTKFYSRVLPATTEYIYVVYTVAGADDFKIKQPTLQIIQGTAAAGDYNFVEFNT